MQDMLQMQRSSRRKITDQAQYKAGTPEAANTSGVVVGIRIAVYYVWPGV